ncbi:dicarboxylate/amino acid:cation symporter [Halopseudomonas sp.]|jgi:Na+/H+-dicarboxylate symporter|uniref:dicarboxylate/amino acid:cation symporter n=1 Tax=Halopseudomonas sp. TaxID=2901191 RepID=UPI0030028DE8
MKRRYFNYSAIADILALTESLGLLLKTRLWLQILIGMIAGIGLGLLISPRGMAVVSNHTAELVAGWVAVPGYVFLALIQMIMVALIFSSIVLGIASCGTGDQLRRLGIRIVPYFLLTTSIAVGLGIVLTELFKPGTYISQVMVGDFSVEGIPQAVDGVSVELQENPVDRHLSAPRSLVNLIPANPLRSALEGSMLQIVVFSIFFGIALLSIQSTRARPFWDIAISLQEVAMKIVSWAMMIAPLAVFGLLTEITAKLGFDAIVGMGGYVGTVMLGLLCLLLFYLVLVYAIARIPPLSFLRHIRELQLLAFSTSSSAAVIPLSIETATKRLGVTESTANFVIPIGASINMDGTAIYQVIAAVFLAQVYGIDLSVPALLLLSATTIGASIGAPSTPGVGIVVLATILGGIGVPVSGIALLIGVDRILDMSRTLVNVTGDITACLVLDRLLSNKYEINHNST